MKTEPRVILTSDRLLFRQHILADLKPFCAMEMDGDVRRYVGGYPRSYEDAKARFMNGPLKTTIGDLAMWATVYKPEAKYIGRCGLYPHHLPDNNVVENEGVLGFYIARDYWGRGLATEAGQAFIDFGFNMLGLKRIVTTTDGKNAASIHILRKLGFSLTGEEDTGIRSFKHFELFNNRLR